MFSFAPFHVPIAVIDYSLWVKLHPKHIGSTSTSTEDLSVPGSLSSLEDTAGDSGQETISIEGVAQNQQPVIVFSPSSFDSAFQSLPASNTTTTATVIHHQATSTDSSPPTTATIISSSPPIQPPLISIDTTSSIDSAIALSLPVNISDIIIDSSSSDEEDYRLPAMSVQRKVSNINSRLSKRDHRGRCARCGKIVYFAERKVAMGQQWHQQCFRCTKCNRFLDPGRHCEHEGKPYCNMCYNDEFGPDGFRVGLPQPRPNEPPHSPEEKSEILSKIKDYNLYKGQSIEQIKYREVNGRIYYEGIFKIYWGLKKPIILSSGGYGRQKSRESSYNYISIDDEGFERMINKAQNGGDDINKDELQRYMELAQFSLGTEDLLSRDLNDLNEAALEVITSNGIVGTGDSTPTHKVSTITEESSEYVLVHSDNETDTEDDEYDVPRETQSLTNSPTKQVVLRQKSDAGDHFTRERSNAGISRRRSASFKKVQKYKKQEAKEEKRSKFIPPYSKSNNLRVTSMQRTEEVIGMLLMKYNVENKPSEFSLVVVHDNGAMEKLHSSDYPLSVRLKIGPSEDVAKVYIMENSDGDDIGISQEAAAYIRFQLPELNVFLKKFEEEEERELDKIKQRFACWKDIIKATLTELDPQMLT
jgi:hypothetical protein